MSVQSPLTPKRNGTVVYEWACRGELVIVLDPIVLVRAKSKISQREYYVVEEGRCTCAGFQFRQTCRHLSIAKLAIATIHTLDTPFIEFVEEKKRRKRSGTQAEVNRGENESPPRTSASGADFR